MRTDKLNTIRLSDSANNKIGVQQESLKTSLLLLKNSRHHVRFEADSENATRWPGISKRKDLAEFQKESV